MKNFSELWRTDSPLPYGEALETMRRAHGERRRGLRPDLLWLLQHTPVITLGRRAGPEDLMMPQEQCGALGIEIHRVERGGRATCHMPGQWVGYPVWGLKERGLGVRRLVEGLEEAMLRTAADHGVSAFRRQGQPGVYCGAGKLGAVGLAVAGGVSLHGFSFNVAADPRWFDLIVPCGHREIAAVSLSDAAPRTVNAQEAAQALLTHLSEIFDTRFG